MNNDEAIEFTNNIFDLIKKARTISHLEIIPDKLEIPGKNRMNIDLYPKIEFAISPDEIRKLMDDKILDNDHKFVPEITSKLADPLTKLLYAIAWKNGDLKKLKHIIKGIVDSEDKNSEQDDALVFYQFGKYLTKVSGEPIIDQHVIRAFAIYKSTDFEEIETLRQMKTLNKTHKLIIKQYKDWLISKELTEDLRIVKDYTYHIDKLLFATGKAIKLSG